MTTYPLFRKELPELNLTISIDKDIITFTGKKMPSNILSGCKKILEKSNIEIWSVSNPAIGTIFSGSFKFFVGGQAHNPNHFTCKEWRNPGLVKQLETILKKICKPNKLNKYIKTL